MRFSYEDWKAIKPASWTTAGHVLRPDMKLLRYSIEEYGWLQPIIVREENNEIIDGYHRWVLAANYPQRLGQEILVGWVSCSDVDAMVMHIILNRATGNLLNRKVSRFVKQILRSGKYEEEELRHMFRMSPDEFELMMDGTLIKMRKVQDHTYNKAWVPTETSGVDIVIERPPNKDG
jgi:ParB-like chromosome segregation protein Spo0J